MVPIGSTVKKRVRVEVRYLAKFSVQRLLAYKNSIVTTGFGVKIWLICA